MAGRVVRPVYLYALAGVVAALVLASGALRITRTKRELVSIYEGSARSLADGVQQLVGQALSLVEVSGHGPADAAKTFALDDVLLDYLFGLAADLDRTLPSATSGEVRGSDPGVFVRVVRGDSAEALGDPFLMPDLNIMVAPILFHENIFIMLKYALNKELLKCAFDEESDKK